MSLLGAIGNILRGEKLGDQSGQPQSPVEPSQSQSAPIGQQPAAAPVNTGPKIIPQIAIDRAECRNTSNGRIECHAFIRNASRVDLELDKINIFGTHFDFGETLDPGESKKFPIYNGPMPRSMSSACDITYIARPEGDYLRANFTVDIINQNNTPEIRFRQLHTKDI